MSELIGAEIKDIEFWRDHLVKAQEFGDSNIKYCEQAGIKIGTFSTYKKRLGFTKGPEKESRKAFVKIESPLPTEETPVVAPRCLPKVSATQVSRLPDAKWLAEFILNLTTSR